MTSRIRLPSDYQLLVEPHVSDDTICQIILNVRNQCIRYGGIGGTVATTEMRYYPEEVVRINPFFSDSESIRSQLETLFSRSEVLDENHTRGLSTERISREIEAGMAEITNVSADFRVIIILFTESTVDEQGEEFQPDFDTQEDSYNGIRRNPPSSLEISQLKRFEYVSESGNSDACSICLDDFIDKEEVMLMRCGHEFHSGCLLRWFEGKSSCPLCRSSIVQNSNNEEVSKQAAID
ncbi:E3 ubiquitin ligase BIG BROTHER-related-like [Papaver somniferum]|uniref:E3 ubiquitin ligase BIG BROTHER-related-like n=1 Tax=Papaver somniferum TaxID=3469 RepID=UPI000E70592A|nr:E3 ubiquitin ligase BIG BROTHER-related-like [Papaver somniferum]